MSDKIIEDARQKILELNKVINERAEELEKEEIEIIKRLEWTTSEAVRLSIDQIPFMGSPTYKLILCSSNFKLISNKQITLVDYSHYINDVVFYPGVFNTNYRNFIGTYNRDSFIKFLSEYKFKEISYDRDLAKLYKLIGELYN